MNHDFVVNQSQSKLLLGFFSSLAFVLAGLVMLHSTGVQLKVGGLATIAFFGIATVLFAWRVSRTEAIVLVFSTTGLTDHRMLEHRVPWSELRAARFHTIYGSHFIELDLLQPDRFPVRGLARLNHMTGWSPHILYLGFLDRSAHEIVLAFEGYWEEHVEGLAQPDDRANADQPAVQILPCSSMGGLSSGP